jgi:hypothetical protein
MKRRLGGWLPRMILRVLWSSAVLWVAALAGSACLLTIALAAPEYSWLSWISLVPIFAVMRVLDPWRALACGGLWGIVFYSLLVTTSSVHVPLEFLPALVLTGAPALYVTLGAALTRRVGYNALLLALGWLGVELSLRPLDLGGGLLVHAHGNGAILQLAGGLLGYGFVAVIVALANAAILAAISAVCVKVQAVGISIQLPGLRTCAFDDDSSHRTKLFLFELFARAPPARLCQDQS